MKRRISENILDVASTGLSVDEIFITLERYFNDGSPSGFHVELPTEFNPSSENKIVALPYFYEEFQNHIQIGELPVTLQNSGGQIPFILHPYVAKREGWKQFLSTKQQGDTLQSQPTASGRTMLVEKDGLWFVKLNFPFILGRFPRELSMFKWISALERSREIESFKKRFPDTLSILNDFGGTFHMSSEGSYSFGTIFRSFVPIPNIIGDHLLVPSFSLFAKPKPPRHQSILADLIFGWSLDFDSFLALFIRPVVESFVFLATNVGLIPEYNAQNVLFQLDLNKKQSRVVLRDHGDCFVDHLVRNELDLHKSFCTYKTIRPSIDEDFYQRRSFAFDFKLSRYLILPLLQEYCSVTNMNLDRAVTATKSLVHNQFGDCKQYFGSNSWYSYPNKRGVGRGSYQKNENPLFR